MARLYGTGCIVGDKKPHASHRGGRQVTESRLFSIQTTSRCWLPSSVCSTMTSAFVCWENLSYTGSQSKDLFGLCTVCGPPHPAVLYFWTKVNKTRNRHHRHHSACSLPLKSHLEESDLSQDSDLLSWCAVRG